eukprot:GAHX01002174.1.p1 GENE.GAHX01002174.1~~GAHX01002174.1.p1  ORF type:complete len:138 (-),score=6.16 GAHX01002174.1:34-447(-)
MARTKGLSKSTKTTPKQPNNTAKPRKSVTYKRKAGMGRQANSIREIRFYRSNIGNLLLKRPFIRLIRNIAEELRESSLRFSLQSVVIIQTATELFCNNLLEDSMLCAIHAGRVTLMQKDIMLVCKIRRFSFRGIRHL